MMNIFGFELAHLAQSVFFASSSLFRTAVTALETTTGPARSKQRI